MQVITFYLNGFQFTNLEYAKLKSGGQVQLPDVQRMKYIKNNNQTLNQELINLPENFDYLNFYLINITQTNEITQYYEIKNGNSLEQSQQILKFLGKLKEIQLPQHQLIFILGPNNANLQIQGQNLASINLHIEYTNIIPLPIILIGFGNIFSYNNFIDVNQLNDYDQFVDNLLTNPLDQPIETFAKLWFFLGFTIFLIASFLLIFLVKKNNQNQ